MFRYQEDLFKEFYTRIEHCLHVREYDIPRALMNYQHSEVDFIKDPSDKNKKRLEQYEYKLLEFEVPLLALQSDLLNKDSILSLRKSDLAKAEKLQKYANKHLIEIWHPLKKIECTKIAAEINATLELKSSRLSELETKFEEEELARKTKAKISSNDSAYILEQDAEEVLLSSSLQQVNITSNENIEVLGASFDSII